MKVIIFGATGATGAELVSQARAAGHQVTAFVRDRTKLQTSSDVRIIEGNVFDAEAVAGAIQGHEAVLTALGARTLGRSDLLERASANITAGMKRHAIRRVIVLGAAGALHDAGKHQKKRQRILFGLIKRTLLRYPMQSSAAQEQLIESSDLDYTVVHPPRLTNGRRTGQYRVQADGLPRDGLTISRADTAHFMVKALSDGAFLKQGPYIAY